jgi:hypothetical protein
MRSLVRRKAETDGIRAATRTVLATIEYLLAVRSQPPIPLATILFTDDPATQVRKPPAAPDCLSKVDENA